MNKKDSALAYSKGMVDMISIIFNLVNGNDKSEIGGENLLNYIQTIMPKCYSFTDKCSFISDTAKLIMSVYENEYNRFEFFWHKGWAAGMARSGVYCKYETDCGTYFVQVSEGHIPCLDNILEEASRCQEPSNTMAFYALLHTCGLVRNAIKHLRHLEMFKILNGFVCISTEGIQCNNSKAFEKDTKLATIVFDS